VIADMERPLRIVEVNPLPTNGLAYTLGAQIEFPEPGVELISAQIAGEGVA
jgi:hypothetical protein